MDLDLYCARVGYRGSRAATLSTLHGLTAAHTGAIPFENVDVLLGRRIELGREALFDKLVRRGRGGYCFEQNGLFLEILGALGFVVQPISARVRWQRSREETPPRTHLFIRVEVDGESWLTDVGVGGMSLTGALRLTDDLEQATPHEPRRLVREGALLYHQIKLGEVWHDVCEFTLEQMPRIDREVASWYTSTHPDSQFRQRLMVARALPDGGRLSLLDRVLTRRHQDGSTQTRTLASPDELLAVLASDFGLTLPADTRFEVLDWS
jgi:N-hydroxyarylamine O-acetyltransferase